ncbi:MAG: hypothetical protein FJW32_03945 [Acidobacteria bacterium]|nr:hypothetical protein [Acidobacteriota bacterium]
MPIPTEFQQAIQALPPRLSAFLQAEISAGNGIAEMHNGGRRFVLKRRVMTRQRASTGGIVYQYADNAFTDEGGGFFIIEPEFEAQPPKREWNHSPSWTPPVQTGSPVTLFIDSMRIDYDKWKEGEGYDLTQIEKANDDDRERIESRLLGSGINGWRDVQALAALDTARARAALKKALKANNNEVRLAVIQYAPHLVSERTRTKTLVQALITGEFYAGLTQALMEVETHHPPEVIDALLHGALRKDEGAVHFAAMLMFLHGKAESSFDWNQRPFFLRFGTKDRAERRAAFEELCGKIGIDPRKYL